MVAGAILWRFESSPGHHYTHMRIADQKASNTLVILVTILLVVFGVFLYNRISVLGEEIAGYEESVAQKTLSNE